MHREAFPDTRRSCRKKHALPSAFHVFSSECFVKKESMRIFAVQIRRGILTCKTTKKNKKMIVVPVKEGENIEKALKKFKRKFEKTGIIKELRSRQQFNKPSVVKRLKKEHAVYVQKLQQIED